MSIEVQPKYCEAWFVETWSNAAGNTSRVFRDFRLLALDKLKFHEIHKQYEELSASKNTLPEVVVEANKQLAIAKSRLVISNKHVTKYRASDDDYEVIYEHLEEDFERLVSWMRKK